jgi:hypothetical protein
MALFSSNTFKDLITRYCRQQRWKIADINDRRAMLAFTMPSDRMQVLYILRYDTTLEFSVPSDLGFSSEDAIPDSLSTMLLRRNAESKVCFWCIEMIGHKHTFSCMYNAESNLIDAEYFARIVRALLQECERLEQALAGMSRYLR